MAAQIKGFNVASFATVAAFHKGAVVAFASYDAIKTNVNKATLAALIVATMREPTAGTNALVDGALTAIGRNVNAEGERNRISIARGALRHAVKGGLVPTVTAGMTERDLLAKVETFCQSHTLRALYDAGRIAPKAANEERKAERETEAARLEADAREAAGVKGAVPAQWSMANVAKALAPMLEAARKGDANAVAMLEHVRLEVASAIVAGTPVPAKAKAPKRTRKAANDAATPLALAS